MGGNALAKPSVRLNPDTYFKVWKVMQLSLGEIFPNVELVKSYFDKPSFGDMDILVTLPECDSWEQFPMENFSFFQNREVVHTKNSKTLSFGYDLLVGRFQVDLIAVRPEHLEVSHLFYDYNDLGGMIGVMAKALGFKFSPEGLRYTLHHGQSEVDDINVSNDVVKILEFLGYDPDKYVSFNKLDGIFKFVTSNIFFDKSLYLLENRDGDSRRRDSKRASYQALLEYLEATKAKEDILFNKEKLAALGMIRANTFFPDLDDKIKLSTLRYMKQRIFKSRVNGPIVTELTGLEGSELGKFLKLLKTKVTMDVFERVLKSKEFGAEFILTTFSEWNNIDI